MKEKWYIHRISFRILFPLISGLILYMAMLMVFGNLADLSGSFFIQEAVFLVVLCYINHEWAIFLLGRRGSQEVLNSAGYMSRFFYFGILLLSSIAISSGVILAYFIFVLKYYHYLTELITLNILMILFHLMVHLFFISMLNIRRYHDFSMQQEEAQGRQLELELESFKTEMNPGLLMECLENLLTLIRKDVRESDRYIQALSNQYRYLLDNRKTEFVNLQEEFKAATELIYLLNGGDATKITFEQEAIPDNISIIPGSLHHIIYQVENLMILDPMNPLSITLSLDEENNLVISHANQPKLVTEQASGMGKLNHSYLHYTGKEISTFEQDGNLMWRIPRLPEIMEENK